MYAQLQPRYRLADQVPDRGQAVAAAGRLDSELTGSSPINAMIQFPADASLYSPETLRVIAEVHGVMQNQSGIGNVWSLETLRRWLAEKGGRPDVATLKQYVEILPQYLVRRFISADQHAVVIAGRVPDIDASKMRPIVAALDRSLASVRAQHPGYTISVTSLSAIAARNSASMIEKLNRGLTIEVVFVAAFIGLAFRSFLVMCASMLPAIFPIVVSGSLLWAARRRIAVRQRHRTHRIVRAGPKRYDPFSQSHAPGGTARRWRREERSARHRASRPSPDFDVRRAVLRAYRDHLFKSALATPVWMVEHPCDDARARSRPDYPAPGDHISAFGIRPAGSDSESAN